MPNNRRKKQKVAAALLIIAAESEDEYEPRAKTKRTIWTHDWLIKRSSEGAHQKLLQEYRENENQKHLYKKFLRMDDSTFEELLALVSPHIAKQDTQLRAAISPSERLAVTLRFLASGDNYKSLSTLFRIAPNTISYIIPEVCDAIYKVLRPIYMNVRFLIFHICLLYIFIEFEILQTFSIGSYNTGKMVVGC